MSQDQQQRLEVATKIAQALIAEPLIVDKRSRLMRILLDVDNEDRPLPTADRLAVASLAVADALLARTVLPTTTDGSNK